MTRSTLLIMLSCLFSLSSCSGWNNIYEGTYNGKNYKIQEKETKGFSTNSLSYRIVVDGLGNIPVDVHHTDYGVPYDTSIYQQVPHLFLSSFDYVQTQDYLFDQGSHTTVLYIDCDTKDADAYFDFFRSEWNNLKSIFKKSSNRFLPDLVGVVVGEQDDFVQVFKGEYKNVSVALRIEPDGRLFLEQPGKKIDYSFDMNVHPKLLLPERKILLDNQLGNIDLKILSEFTNKENKKLKELFSIEQISLKGYSSNIQKNHLNKALNYYHNGQKEEAKVAFDNLLMQGIPDDSTHSVVSWYNAKLMCEEGNCADAATLWSNALLFSDSIPTLHQEIVADKKKYE